MSPGSGPLAPHVVVPGPVDGWLAVVRGDSALLVRSGTTSPEELYDSLSGPDAVRAVIERLTAGGFAATPDFGLVAGSTTGPRHVVVRGPVEVELPEGAVSGAEVSTWAERVVSAAATYRIVAPAGSDAASASPLPLADGAMWASSVASADAAAGSPADQGEVPAAMPAGPPVSDAGSGSTSDPGPSSDSSSISDSGSSPDSGSIVEETVLPETTVHPDAVVAPSPAAPETPAPAETLVPDASEPSASEPPGSAVVEPAPTTDETPAGYDHLFEATIMRPVEAAAVRPVEDDEADHPSVPPAAAPLDAPVDEALADGDHDGLTVMSSDVEGLAERERPAESEVARPDAQAGYVVVLPDGTREPLDGELLVGRSPSGRVTGDRMPRLVTLSGDPDISRTHVRIALEGDTVVVTDMHSRNGTTLRIAGQAPQLLRAGEPAAVIPGSVVDLGGGTVLTIEQSDAGGGA